MSLAPRTRAEKGTPRARTESIRRTSKLALARGAILYPPTDHHRPQTRRDCEDMERPCPFVSCRYHLALDVDPARGSVKRNFPHLDVHEMAETCVLDLAERGGMTLEEIALAMNLTRERVRQIEDGVLRGMREDAQLAAHAQELDGAEDSDADGLLGVDGDFALDDFIDSVADIARGGGREAA
jgi:hypothetical protein